MKTIQLTEEQLVSLREIVRARLDTAIAERKESTPGGEVHANATRDMIELTILISTLA